MDEKKIDIELIQLKEEIKRLKDRLNTLETGLNSDAYYVTNSGGTSFYKITIVNGKVTAIT